MSRCPFSISPSIPRNTMLSYGRGQDAKCNAPSASTATQCAPSSPAPRSRRVGKLFARYEDLAIDAEAALGRFENLYEKPFRRVRRLLRRTEHHVGNALDQGAPLFEREHAGGDLELHQRRA